jgi:hypothetical protein
MRELAPEEEAQTVTRIRVTSSIFSASSNSNQIEPIDSD